jgi:hypothetical protein
MTVFPSVIYPATQGIVRELRSDWLTMHCCWRVVPLPPSTTIEPVPVLGLTFFWLTIAWSLSSLWSPKQ